MKRQKNAHETPKGRRDVKKWPIVLLSILLIAGSLFTGLSYIHSLENAFLDNVQFYMDEIAAHDKRSVDQEIEKQWERLEVIGRKLTLESYGSGLDIQHFLNLEMAATGFEGLMLLDDQGRAHEANYMIQDVSDKEWASLFLERKEAFVLPNQSRTMFIVRDNSLLYGVPIDPVTVGDTTFVGLVGSYRMTTVKDSLQVDFFDGHGVAEVVGRDGTVITTEITQRGEALENLLNRLEDGRWVSGDSYESIAEKLSRCEVFHSVYTYGGGTHILTSEPLDNADWMVVVQVPASVASGQTSMFLMPRKK